MKTQNNPSKTTITQHQTRPVWLWNKLKVWIRRGGGGALENDYIPEAYVFDRPPSVGGSMTDVLGSPSKPENNQKQAIRIILHYFIIW